MTPSDVAAELYGLDLSAFTAERNARAAASGADRAAIAAYPKPSAAAWLVNQVVRSAPDAVAAAFALGPELRAAQASFDREALRELGTRRRAALADLAESARRVSVDRGRPLSSGIADEVEQTFLAGIVDAAAADAVQTGCLIRALHTIGGEPVDLDGAVAAHGTGFAGDAAAHRARGKAAPASGPDRAAKARAEVALAQTQAAAAREARDAVDDELRAAVDHHERLGAARDAAMAEADRLEREVGEAERRRRESIRNLDRANRRLEAAERVLARAEATAGQG